MHPQLARAPWNFQRVSHARSSRTGRGHTTTGTGRNKVWAPRPGLSNRLYGNKDTRGRPTSTDNRRPGMLNPESRNDRDEAKNTEKNGDRRR